MLEFETVLTHSYYYATENLLYVKLKGDEEITLEKIVLHNEQSLFTLGEISTKTIYDVRNIEFSHIPREVLKYVSDSPHGKYQSEEAFILSGLGQKILANFYLKVMKPKVKTKMFVTLKDALNWLEIKNQKPFLPRFE